MQKVRYELIALLLLCSVSAAEAQISIGIGLPNVSIGINLPLYPELVLVPGTQSTMLHAWMATISFTTACTGSTRTITGTRVPGTTAPGGWWIRRLCRCSSCVSPCTTTGARLSTFAAGCRMRPHAGASTGAVDGSSVEADGIGGIAALYMRQPPCPFTRDSIPATGIRGR